MRIMIKLIKDYDVLNNLKFMILLMGIQIFPCYPKTFNYKNKKIGSERKRI